MQLSTPTQAVTRSFEMSWITALKVGILASGMENVLNWYPGDGVTDDTAAINRAISDQNRCGPWVCQSSTTSPAIIYFPAGTYIISSSIIMYYMTQIHGNPNSLPVLKATAGLSGLGVIDASKYNDQNGAPGWTSTNVFMRQIRNVVVDLTAIPPDRDAKGIHWPASQATSLQNVKVVMTPAANSKHTGIFVENGKHHYLALVLIMIPFPIPDPVKTVFVGSEDGSQD